MPCAYNAPAYTNKTLLDYKTKTTLLESQNT